MVLVMTICVNVLKVGVCGGGGEGHRDRSQGFIYARCHGLHELSN